MLQVKNVSFDYADVPVLQGVNFLVRPGFMLHLRGSNGAGKTTLLKLLAGILHPTAGDILYGGNSITEDKLGYQHHLCYVGHKTGVSPLLTVREHCHFELHPDQGIMSFDELMKAFSLQGLEDVPCSILSVGQRRRVGLLRLLVSNASLWLLDEPLVALDQKTVDVLIHVLRKHLAEGGMIVLTSHQSLPFRSCECQEYDL